MANKRPDGDGLVRKRSDGRWEGRIVVGHKEDGKPIYRSVFAKTQMRSMMISMTLLIMCMKRPTTMGLVVSP